MMGAVTLDGVTLGLDIAGRAPLRLRIGGVLHEVVEQAAGSGAFAVTIDGQIFNGWRYRAGDVVHVRLAGRTWAVAIADPAVGTAGAAASGDELRAALPGTVVDVRIAAGAAVKRGETLLTIESMKVQMALAAPRDGIVAAVHVAPNAVFDRDALLVALRPEA